MTEFILSSVLRTWLKVVLCPKFASKVACQYLVVIDFSLVVLEQSGISIISNTSHHITSYRIYQIQSCVSVLRGDKEVGLDRREVEWHADGVPAHEGVGDKLAGQFDLVAMFERHIGRRQQ